MASAFYQNAPTKAYGARKRVCAHPYVNWLLPAWVFYLAGAVGYVVIDLLSVTRAAVSDYQYAVLFAVMAAIYLVDAGFYFLAWLIPELEKRDHEVMRASEDRTKVPHNAIFISKGKVVQIDAAAWGELLYVFSAAFGMAAAGCAFLIPVDSDNRIAAGVSAIAALMAYSSMLWISNTLYMIDAFCYWSAWYNKYATTPPEKKPKVCFDGYFWADGILLTIPSFGYFITSFVVVFRIYSLSLEFSDSSIRELISQYQSMLIVARTFNVVFDFIYVADACVYALAWLGDADTIKQLRIERGQDVPEVDLGQSFLILPREDQVT